MVCGCLSIDKGRAITNDKGKFSILLRYNNLDDNLEFFTISKNKKYSVGNYQYIYKIKSIINKSSLKIDAYRLAKIKIFIKNKTPFDYNDRIDIRYFNYFNAINSNLKFLNFSRDKLINHGISNVFFDNGNNISSMSEWKGKNVNSIIEGKLRAYKKVFISYDLTKNGISSKEVTEAKFLNPDVENEYIIEY